MLIAGIALIALGAFALLFPLGRAFEAVRYGLCAAGAILFFLALYSCTKDGVKGFWELIGIIISISIPAGIIVAVWEYIEENYAEPLLAIGGAMVAIGAALLLVKFVIYCMPENYASESSYASSSYSDSAPHPSSYCAGEPEYTRMRLDYQTGEFVRREMPQVQELRDTLRRGYRALESQKEYLNYKLANLSSEDAKENTRRKKGELEDKISAAQRSYAQANKNIEELYAQFKAAQEASEAVPAENGEAGGYSEPQTPPPPPKISDYFYKVDSIKNILQTGINNLK